ncbi:hypothetical protein [Alicyclobacillus dauci]|uniref:Uncharacterized protein n=1 Tax=Alicyclobacillus dauci TaxID=1475485 RepID=A0ABY6Z1F8_9BACL|nr:hypothetical protein [Alicyclobacillus dauci]WAH36418.1 hypothetical protein NZD86_19700 [Alicyclobacillus dauci]
MTHNNTWAVLGASFALLLTVVGCGQRGEGGGINTDIFTNAPSGGQNTTAPNPTNVTNTSITAPPARSHPTNGTTNGSQPRVTGGTPGSTPPRVTGGAPPTPRPRITNATTPNVPPSTGSNTTSTNASSTTDNSTAGGTNVGQPSIVNGTAGNQTANITSSGAVTKPVVWQTQTQPLGAGVVVSLSVPAQWVKYRATVEGTSGYEWTNPANAKERIAVMATRNQIVMRNKQGAWDVTGLFNRNKGIQWTSLSPDHLKGYFVDSNPNGLPSPRSTVTPNPYTTSGVVQIRMNPNPTAVLVEARAPQRITQTAIASVRVH